MTTAAPITPGGRGRPRDPRHDAAILQAAIALVGEVGYDRMTVDSIAGRAGVSKPTIYRRWPDGKAQLIADAIRLHQAERGESPDTGSLRGDLIALVAELTGQLLDNAHLAAGLTSQLRASPELAELFREHMVRRDRQRWAELVRRAIERGDLASGDEPSELFAAVAPSVIHTRVLLTGESVDPPFAERLVDTILLPILLHPPSADPSRTAS